MTQMILEAVFSMSRDGNICTVCLNIYNIKIMINVLYRMQYTNVLYILAHVSSINIKPLQADYQCKAVKLDPYLWTEDEILAVGSRGDGEGEGHVQYRRGTMKV